MICNHEHTVALVYCTSVHKDRKGISWEVEENHQK